MECHVKEKRILKKKLLGIQNYTSIEGKPYRISSHLKSYGLAKPPDSSCSPTPETVPQRSQLKRLFNIGGSAANQESKNPTRLFDLKMIMVRMR
jgi:hypothetical protein